jgi:hypothetical protein
MDASTELAERIDRLCALAARPDADPSLVDEMNDMLSEGYAHVLATEQRLAEFEERVVDLLVAGDERRSRELAVIDARRRALARHAARLREQLTLMHERFVALSAR